MSRADDEIRRAALCRDIGRRLAIASLPEVEAIDRRLLAIEKLRDEPVVVESDGSVWPLVAEIGGEG